jgi:hypothetical protein
MKKIRLYTVRALTAFAAVCFIFCACLLDAKSDVPFYAGVASGFWLLLVAWANFDSADKRMKGRK